MIQKTVEILNKTGLHARPAAKFVEKANKFKGKITIEKDGKRADAKSILGVLGLGVGQGSKIKITAEGEDEQEAVEQLVELLNSFEE
ncbi:MAG: phosphocarrier protein HPr [Thermosediminibacterales bacterium]|nr:phosphocarrier protein HPr [Thermosediminibacterales bacterium]MDK2836625.1 phosphocarrier protein HPr [Thermosediminibacterales bacterium]